MKKMGKKMGKYMTRIILLAVFAMTASLAMAEEPDVNLDDKMDNYNLKHDGVIKGKVRVESKFVEEPLNSPVRIEVSVTCLKKFKKVFAVKSPVWDAFDYGKPEAKTQLSSFDSDKQILTVYFRTSKVDQEEGRAYFDKALTRVFELKGICK